MALNIANMKNAVHADGLREDDAALLDRLVAEYSAHIGGNAEKLRYYNDEVSGKRLDKKIPAEIANIRVAPGWVAKAVNMLARRSIFDGVTVRANNPADEETVERIVEDNRLGMKYATASPSELIFGAGVWTISPQEAEDEPSAVVNFHDFTEAACLWDYRRERVRCGFVIEDMMQPKPNANFVPTLLVMHTDENVIEISSEDGKVWVADYKPHALGRPLMVAMRFNPTKDHPMGKSRVSKTCRWLTRELILATQNLLVHAQNNALPQKILSGVSEQQIEEIAANLVKAYSSDLLVLTNNEDGGTPQYSTHGGSGVEQHIRLIESIARDFASETDLPLSAFGVLGQNYTSSDALRASSDDLIILAESMNERNAEALREVVRIAFCVTEGISYSELEERGIRLAIQWRDPSKPSMAAVSDAMVKQAAVTPWLTETSVYWEKLGYSESERERLFAEKKSAQAAASIEGILAGKSQAVTDGTAA